MTFHLNEIARALAKAKTSDLQSGLIDFHKSLQTLFPLNYSLLSLYDAQKGTLSYKVFISEDRMMLIDETVRLSGAAQQDAMHMFQSKVSLHDGHRRNALHKETQQHFSGHGAYSGIDFTTRLGTDLYGHFGLIAAGTDRYGESHADCGRQLYETIADAIHHFLDKIELAQLKERIVFENEELRKRLGYLAKASIIGADSTLKEVMQQVAAVAGTNSTVLLQGETGVGKEVIATAIHQQSKRAEGPFITINCGAIPEALFESEMFGHEKGAFTGAYATRRGHLEQASGGTIFLDEIGELPLDAQVKLLRVLENGELQRVGGNRKLSVDIRLIAATNRDLEAMVQAGTFRKDLWFRLSVFPIHIQPLRQRNADIPLLAQSFVTQKAREMHLPDIPRLAPEALEQLLAYDWPGNIRELKNVIERALILCQGETLSFPFLSVAGNYRETDAQRPESGGFPTMEEMIIQHIRKGLILAGGRINGPDGAAELLDMHPSTLRSRMRKYGITLSRQLDE